MKAVRLPKPERGEGDPVMDGRVPALESPVVVELHGHGHHRYVVRAVPTESGPVLVELRILGDGSSLDYDALSPPLARRLAYAAMQWLSSAGGLWATPGDTDETAAKPEEADTIRRRRKATDELLTEVARHVERAVLLGLPIRPYVGQQMNRSKPAVARYIAEAKRQGYLPDTPLPKTQPETRKPPTRRK